MTKFHWLIFACVFVVLFEALSLSGVRFQPSIAAPLFLLIIVGIGHETLWHGLKALFTLNLASIQLLMVIAVSGAFYLGQYEEAAVVIVLYTLAEKLEDLGIARSKLSIENLLSKMPKEVLIKGKENLTPVNLVVIGDIIAIKPGDIIALDGEVIEGSSSVDESTITGEPIPQDKHIGDKVFAGTWNQQGYLEVRITKTAKESSLAKIKEMTANALKSKAKTQLFIEKFARIYTPTVIFIALAVTIIPTLFLGKNFNDWFVESLTLLVIACPCALVISTPISIYSAVSNATTKGVLIKGGKYLEALGQLKAIAFDKTRTLTEGHPHVTDVIPIGTHTVESLLSCAAGIEQFSEHPLSQSIVNAAQNEKYTFHPAESFQSFIGKGVKGDCLVCKDRHHCIGKLQFILEEHQVPVNVVNEVDRLQKQGKTVIVVSTHKEVEGIIAFSDKIRPESKSTIDDLHKMGIQTILLTGDHLMPAQAVADELNIPIVKAELLPDEKAKEIQSLMKKYKVVGMMGDGVNDAPALALASVGISMNTLGSDIAIDAASVVILSDHLKKLPSLINLGRRALNIIHFNTVWAIGVKILFIALAIAGKSNLVLAIFADVGVTFLVILNSLRLTRN
jgi:Cd2+/Zn2+-exporting ATPase